MAEKHLIVVGGGPAGLACAALAAQEGLRVTLIAPPARPDGRTTALMQPALRLLRYIGIWPGTLQSHCAALQHLRLIDDTGNMVSAPDITFSAREMELDAFGWNVPLNELGEQLLDRCKALKVNHTIATAVDAQIAPEKIIVSCSDGSRIEGQVAIAADGAQSLLRKVANIGTSEWDYDQSALVTAFDHTAAHQGISTEWHKEAGPFTTVPLPGKRSALVWMVRPSRAQELAALDDRSIATEIQLETHGQLGLISNCAPRHIIAMKGLRANRLAQNRVIVIGEAAHVQPPIGAQGLNLSLRDVGHTVDLILANDDPGNEAALGAYHTARMDDVMPRQLAVHALNASLLGELLPGPTGKLGTDLGHLARAAALFAVANLKPLRQRIMAQGLGSSSNLPFAMRA